MRYDQRHDWQTLAWFAYSLATCLGAGLMPGAAVAASGGRADSRAFRRTVEQAKAACDEGASLSEALALNGWRFPYFFLPVLRAGELSGRQTTALMLLHDYCLRMHPTVLLLRNTLLYPLAGMLLAGAFGIGAFLVFGLYAQASLALRSGCSTLLVVGLALYAIPRVPTVRLMLDRVLVRLPIVRNVEMDLAASLFFGAYGLLLQASGTDVLEMFDMSLPTIRNRAIQEDFLAARALLAQGCGYETAFQAPRFLDPQHKAQITTGALSGSLDHCLEHVVAAAKGRLGTTLQALNQIIYRAAVFFAGGSIYATIWVCIRARAAH